MPIGKILLTGKNGQVGWELQRALATLGEVIALGHQDMDLGNPDAIRRAVREHTPNLIVNAAAYTAVDKAEEETGIAMAINGTAPGILAEEAKRAGAFLVHFSTDYVFDGEKKTPYTEEDAPNPINVYGKTKLAGEQAIQAVGAPHLILRTSWVYGARGKNFLLTILRLARERPELKVVNDQTGAPTWSRMIAEATSQILVQFYGRLKSDPSLLANISGVYHLTGSGETTWFGFAEAILAEAARLISSPSVRLTPISTAEYPLPAGRPQNSLMSNRKLSDTFGLAMPLWQEMVKLCLEEGRCS